MLAGLAFALPAASPVSAVTATPWSAYLSGPRHSSYNAADTTITTANAGSLVKKWVWKGDKPTMPGQPGPALFSSPTVVGGYVYIGANNGYFYKISEATGVTAAKVFLGFQPKLTCAARGFVSTATVTNNSSGTETVYVGAPDGYLYALNASDLSQQWRSPVDIPSKTVSDYFMWSSPTIANGKIYIGSASHCDKPLTRGDVTGFDQSTGAQIGRFYTVPSGVLGGGIWTSPAVDSAGNVYVSTGTQPKTTTTRYSSVSIVKLTSSLNFISQFTVPNSQLGGDGDFGGSPTIFGSDVGACNKNGNYYAVNMTTMAVAWQANIGAPSSSANFAQCSAAAVYDGTSLYLAGDATTIGGVAYQGSIRRIDPATGKFLWETGLPNFALGSATLNGSGVLAVGTDGVSTTKNAVYLVDAATGKILRTLTTGGSFFAQSTFADGSVFTADFSQGLSRWGL